MLTLDATTSSCASAPRVRIDVRSVVVRLALRYVSEERGWRPCGRGGGAGHRACGCLRISDHCSGDGQPVDVLVTRDTPSDCQDALDALLAGSTRSVVLWDEPDTLGAAIEALHHRSAVIPERVIRLALEAPRLNARQRKTLRLVAAGRSNVEISAALHQSSSTTKRDVAELLATFDAPNRACLTSMANRLGFL